MTSALHHRSGAHHPPAPRPRLRSLFVGRLVFPTCHGPRSVIVECVRADDGYTLHLPAFNEASNYLADAPVSLTAVETDDDPGACINGRSRLIADGEVSARTAALLERWPDGPAAHYFHITPATDVLVRPTTPRPGPPRGRRGDPQRRPAHPTSTPEASTTPSADEQLRG